MTDLSQLHLKIEEWERMAANPGQREKWLNKTGLAPATPSQHIIPMQQEIFRLREALAEAVYEIKLTHNFFKEEKKQSSLTRCS